MNRVTVIGAGLAGSEAAWQAAQRGVLVTLYEMRPRVMTPAHSTDKFGELVCSNSLRGASLENAAGLLKEELARLNSLIMESAKVNEVPAGGALAVDREGFSSLITDKIENHPNITVVREELKEIPEGIVIIATGPLTSDSLAERIKELTGEDYLSFFDAAAPIVTYESLNHDKVFWASRYEKGGEDYVNCPLSEEEYRIFWEALTGATQQELHEFEDKSFFEGCLPVEEIGRRGYQTLAHGPLKPVGLVDPRAGKTPYAVVQLRRDNKEGTLFNLVGFQTNLKWGEQERVFRLIPGLEEAEFVRFGVMHRNTFVKAPVLLEPSLQLKRDKRILFAGQITGTEGYIEATAGGLVAGINAARMVKNEQVLVFPKETAIGSLFEYISTANAKDFQPMNVAFGLFPSLEKAPRKKRERRQLYSRRALEILEDFCIAQGV